MPNTKTPATQPTQRTDEGRAERHLPEQRGAGASAGLLAAIWIAGAIVAVAVLFYIAVS
ncbi:MAG TPA: hypothetical protein VF405_10235 [Gammaproteobacteria bacterium]